METMAAALKYSKAFDEFLATVDDEEYVKLFKKIHHEMTSNKCRDDDYLRRDANTTKECMDAHRQKLYEKARDWSLDLQAELKDKVQGMPWGDRHAYMVGLLDNVIWDGVQKLNKELVSNKKNFVDKLGKKQQKAYSEHEARLASDEERLLGAFQSFTVRL